MRSVCARIRRGSFVCCFLGLFPLVTVFLCGVFGLVGVFFSSCSCFGLFIFTGPHGCRYHLLFPIGVDVFVFYYYCLQLLLLSLGFTRLQFPLILFSFGINKLPVLRDSEFIRGIVERISGFVYKEESCIAGNVFVFLYACGSFLFTACSLFPFLDLQWVAARTHCLLLLLLLSFGVLPAGLWLEGLYFFLESILCSTCSIPALYRGFDCSISTTGVLQ